jgi:hypothetical protein
MTGTYEATRGSLFSLSCPELPIRVAEDCQLLPLLSEVALNGVPSTFTRPRLSATRAIVHTDADRARSCLVRNCPDGASRRWVLPAVPLYTILRKMPVGQLTRNGVQ